jgi:glutathione S-transferase
LDELEIEYKSVIVPTVLPLRKQVFEISGQYYVPVLVDGDTVLTETPDILDHLDALASTQSGATPEGQHPVEDPVNESLP